jgi:hypothetical protein
MHLPSRIAITCALAIVLAISGASQDAAPKPIGEIFASDASVTGAVQLAGAGMQVMSGSAVGAGQAPALLQLSRGGNMRVCPRTSLSISSSHSGRDLMFGMNSGAVEADYSLAASADAILTPDFRILLAGPGRFHVAIGSDAKGNTCVRPLANNTASVIVSELMGDGTYQVKPDEQVMFENGKLTNVYRVIADCGCPGPIPVQRAAVPVPEAPSLASLRKGPPPPSMSIPMDAPLSPAPASTTAPLPASQPGEVHVEVEAPFVFSAAEPEPAPLVRIAQLRFTSAPPFAIVPPPPQPADLRPAPPPSQVVEVSAVPKKKSGFFGKVRSFFASVFH